MGWSPPGSLADVSLLAARPDLSEVVELRGEWQQAAGSVAFPAWGLSCLPFLHFFLEPPHAEQGSIGYGQADRHRR